jgi:hypothetical protein
MRIGYFLSCEEYAPGEIIEQAMLAEQACTTSGPNSRRSRSS